MNEQTLKIGGAGKTLHRLLGYLPALIIFPILVITLYNNFSRLSIEKIDFAVWPLILSACLLVVHFTISGLGWWLLLNFLGARISVYQAIRISVLSLLGKYIPGKVWTILGRVYMGDRLGLSKKLAFAATAYEFFFFTISGLLVLFVVTFLFPSKLSQFRSYYVVLLALLTLSVAFPNIIVTSMNIVLRLAKKNPINASLSHLQVLSAFFNYSGSWLMSALSFYFFVQAIFQEISFPLLTGALILAYMAGFVFIFTPGGLGIREGTLYYILSLGGMPIAQAILIALACRVWSTAGELLVVVPLLLYKGKGASHNG